MINGAVLGSPIIHSLSPLLHTSAYELLSVQATYDAIDLASGELASFLADTKLNALSLTMPLKEEAIALADVISEISVQINCGNTLTLIQGRWHLTSTDVEGFKFSLQSIENLSTCLIIGAGATARALAAALSPNLKELSVINRNPDRISHMNIAAGRSDITYLPWAPCDEINRYDLIVNTTPAGAADFFCDAIVNPQGTLFEVLYSPWPSEIMKRWRSSSQLAIDGLELLIHQAISQVEIFAGVKVDRDSMYKILRKLALEKIST